MNYRLNTIIILFDLIRGIKEIKLNNANRSRRWKWEQSEANLYLVNQSYARSNELYLRIPHYLGELRNFIILFLAASAVISGDMTIGVMVAIIFILLQLNNPLKQIIDFGLGWLDTRLSLERMNEINSRHSESNEIKLSSLPEDCTITGNQISFRYPRATAILGFKKPGLQNF